MTTDTSTGSITELLRQNPSLPKIMEFVESEAQKIATKRLREQRGEKHVN